MFIKALDAYVKKCQELTSKVTDEVPQDEEKLEEMMTNFTSLLQGFAFQFASTS